jgi:hypothetical protein
VNKLVRSCLPGLALAIAMLPLSSEGASSPRPELEQTLSLIRELGSLVDRSQFDTDALLDKLEYDQDNIVRFVTEEVSYQPYVGLLRGPQVTLT